MNHLAHKFYAVTFNSFYVFLRETLERRIPRKVDLKDFPLNGVHTMFTDTILIMSPDIIDIFSRRLS